MNLTFHRDEKIEAAASSSTLDCGSFPAMTGVRLDPARGRMVATNGRILAVVPCEAQPDSEAEDIAKARPVTVPASVIKAARKGIGKHLPPLLDVNGKVRARTADGWMESEPLEDEYPDFDACFPKAKDRKGALVVRLDAALLKALADALGAERGITLEIPPTKGAPIIAWTDRRPTDTTCTHYGIIMPITA